MISICIPVYNFNVTDLVTELLRQTNKLKVDCEIILIDDASDNDYKIRNEDVCNNATYIKLDKNIGRAAIRNLFLQYATYDHLLFIDCDSVIISTDYLSLYVDTLTHRKPDIICGGRIYDATLPDKNHFLRWKYGIVKESKPLKVRMKNPNKSFMTNNFAISKAIFENIQFDERLKNYGHEDTLFGYQLNKTGINIFHIDNPLMNGDIENNALYLEKTEKGIKNLAYILQYVNYDNDFIEDVSLLKFYFELKRKHLIYPIKILFSIFKNPLKSILCKGYVSLKLFDFYKLGLLIKSL